ncbi:MAG: Crp/Fnr family transcriptional regulator [Bacteroidota bacterium]
MSTTSYRIDSPRERTKDNYPLSNQLSVDRDATTEDEEYLFKEMGLQYRFKSVPKNSFLYLCKDQMKNLYILKEGYVLLGYYSECGREVFSSILSEGDVFGSFGVQQAGSNEFARTLTKASFVVINNWNLSNIKNFNTPFVVNIFNQLARRTSDLENKFLSLAYKDARTRVIEFIKQLAMNFGYRNGEKIVIEKFLTHQDIAKLTNVSRQFATSMMSKLKSDGVISYNRKLIVINGDLDLLD